MTERELSATARAMVAGGKGVLAMDESTGTADKRFAEVGLPQTEEARRAYRAMLVTTPDLGTYISAAILFDETVRQQTNDGTPFITVLADAGIIPGIKVDLGAVPLAGHIGERITEGLDGLRARLLEYRQMGLRFAKWRAVLSVGDGMPSRGCIDANAHALARYAALCQEAGVVPIVEPEVLMTGDHTMERSALITEEVLRSVFDQLAIQKVVLEAMILKPSMVLPGSTSTAQASAEAVADATLRCLLHVVPAAVPGIAFLSGGQSGPMASARLNAMHVRPGTSASALPWALTFSFGRALQEPALAIWAADDSQQAPAQRALLHRAQCNHAALRGEYSASMESDVVVAVDVASVARSAQP